MDVAIPPVGQAWQSFSDQWLALTLNDPPDFEQWQEEFAEQIRLNIGLEDLSKTSWCSCEIAKIMMHRLKPTIYGLDQECGLITYRCDDEMIPHWDALLGYAMTLNLALINELTRP